MKNIYFAIIVCFIVILKYIKIYFYFLARKDNKRCRKKSDSPKAVRIAGPLLAGLSVYYKIYSS